MKKSILCFMAGSIVTSGLLLTVRSLIGKVNYLIMLNNNWESSNSIILGIALLLFGLFIFDLNSNKEKL